MKYLDWKSTYIQEHEESIKFDINLLLTTFENEFPSYESILISTDFIKIVDDHVRLIHDIFKSRKKAEMLMKEQAHECPAYFGFLQKILKKKLLPSILVFRTSNDRMKVEFDSVQSKIFFASQLGVEKFTKDKGLSGKTCPIQDDKQQNSLKFYVNEACNRRLAFVFPSQVMRDKFYELLNLKNYTENLEQNTSIFLRKEYYTLTNQAFFIPLPSKLQFTDENYVTCRLTLLQIALNDTLINNLVKIIQGYACALDGETGKILDEKLQVKSLGNHSFLSKFKLFSKETHLKRNYKISILSNK